jgi:GPH family glycoside/pentoside/hexuronide:cation symporter
MLSWVFLAGRVWDAVTDPLMGHLSDRTHTRWGRRRPYFLLSAVPICVLFYLIWIPTPTLSATQLFAYLMVCYLALYTFWTVFEIPYVALGMELTPVYDERTRLFGGRQAFYVAGMAVGMLAPELFARAAGSLRLGYSRMAVFFGVLTAILMLVAFVRVRERHPVRTQSSMPLLQGLRTTLRNRSFRVLLAVYLASVVGGSFIAPLTLYVAKYVIVARWVVPYVMLAYLIGSVASIPLWVRLSTKVGKNRAWSIALGLATVSYAITYSYHQGTWELWIVMAVLVGAANGCSMTIGLSLCADVIDADELETGRRREGAFMGVLKFTDKAAVGLAVFVGMQGLDAVGYQPNVPQGETVIRGIKVLYCVLPSVCHLVALVALRRFPLTRESHAEIRRQLDARASATP